MRPTSILLASLLAAGLTAGCTGDTADLGASAPLTADDGAAPADPDAPIPVEADGGIGGPGDPVVTSNLIVSGEQVEVTGTCLVDDAPATYRLDLAGGGTLTVTTGDEGGAARLELDGTTYVSSDDAPPSLTQSPGAVVAQGEVAADGEQRFVDATIGTTDLAAC